MVRTPKRRGLIGTLLIISAKSAKLLKLVKVAKPALTFGSMALSAFAYAFWLGPWFAIGLITMLFVHEMGHVVALQLRGYKISSPVFIPFLGAAIFVPKFANRDDEAYVGYGGPLLGSAGAVVLFGIWFLLPKDTSLSQIVLITSYAATYLNLFNMIPISPLDGGRITQAAGTWFQYVGLTALLVFSFFFREPSILLIWILVLVDLTILPPKMRAVAAVVCATGMILLMCLGYGDQPVWVNAIDIIIATLFTVLTVMNAFWGKAELFVADLRPDLAVPKKISWFLYYAGLTVALVVLMLFQHSLLPTIPGQ